MVLVVKNPPASAGEAGSIPGLGRFPREGNGNPLQYSCLENPMARGAWPAAVVGVAQSQTRLSLHVYNPVDTLISDIQSPEWWENEFLLFSVPQLTVLSVEGSPGKWAGLLCFCGLVGPSWVLLVRGLSIAAGTGVTWRLYRAGCPRRSTHMAVVGAVFGWGPQLGLWTGAPTCDTVFSQHGSVSRTTVPKRQWGPGRKSAQQLFRCVLFLTPFREM